MDKEIAENRSNDDSSSSMEYYDSFQDSPMEVDEEGDGANIARQQLSHSTTNGDLRDTSSEKNTEPEYHRTLINIANNSDFTGDDSFEFIEFPPNDGPQQNDSYVTGTDDTERDYVGQSSDLLTSEKHLQENCYVCENDKESERAGRAIQTDPSSFERHRDSKPQYSSCSESSSQNTDKSDDDQETANNANRHMQSHLRTPELGSEDENTKHKLYHQDNHHACFLENSTSPLIYSEQGDKDFLKDNDHDKQKISKHEQKYFNSHPSDTPISNADDHSLIGNISNIQVSRDDLFEYQEGTTSVADQVHLNEITSALKLYDESRYEPDKNTENKRGEENTEQPGLTSSRRSHASPRTSSSSFEAHPDQVEESDKEEEITGSNFSNMIGKYNEDSQCFYENDTQERNRQERFHSKKPVTGSKNMDAVSQAEDFDKDEEITGNKCYFIHPNIECHMSGLQIGSDEENTNAKVYEHEYSNFHSSKESSSSSKYCTKYNEDSQYVDEDDEEERKRQESSHSKMPLTDSKSSDAGSQEDFSEHEKKQRLLQNLNHNQSSAYDLSMGRKITRHVTERDPEYDKACLSGTSSPLRKDNETDHEEGDYPHYGHLQEIDLPHKERSYIDIDNHSGKNKLTLMTTTQENSADEGDISDEYPTEHDEDNDDDRLNCPTISRDDFVYTQQSWEIYIKSNEYIPDWEEDDEDELEKLWTRTKFAGRKNKKFYRDVISYDEDEEDNVEESVIKGWKEGENVLVGNPSKEILQKRECFKNDSGDTWDNKNLKQIALGGARPKTYKKRHEELVHVSHRVEYEDGGSHQRSRRRHFQETVYSQSSQWYSEDDSDSDFMPTISNHHKARYYERTGDCEFGDDFDQKNQLEESLSRQMILEGDNQDHHALSSNSHYSKVRYSKSIYDEGDLPRNGYGIDRNADHKLSDEEASDYNAYPIVEYLAQQPNFGTDAETLLTRFGSGEGVLETIVNDSHIFHCTDNWVKLTPSVYVCPSYLSKKGCSNKSSCLGFHICQNFLINGCKDVDCIMGHNIQTSHNKKVLESFCMENLESLVVLKIVGPLLGSFVSTRKEVHVPKVNKGNSLTPTSCYNNQSSKHKDNIKNSKPISIYPNLKKLFESSMKDTQGATKTFGTVWSHYTGGDTEIPEICSKALESVCVHETDGCKRLHANLPYHWQIKTARDNGWMNLQKHQVRHLEEKYCNPALAGTTLPPTDKNVKPTLTHLILENKVWYADFINMILVDDSPQESYLLRRLQLQTVGKGNKWRSHIWYFQDHEGAWVPYGEIVTVGKHKIKSKVKSSDIEQCYLKGEKNKFNIYDFKLHYEIDFAKMVQINTKTDTAREVRRRPKPTENTDKLNIKY